MSGAFSNGSDAQLISGGVMPRQITRALAARWLLICLAALSCSAGLVLMSSEFGYDVEVIDMPIAILVAVLVAAGAFFAVLVPDLVRRSSAIVGRAETWIFVFILVVGAAARLALFASDPILENDFYRYFWDGAVINAGFSPYQYSPLAIRSGEAPAALLALAGQAGDVMERINNQNLTTIYPPVAQAAFAISYWIEPWSMSSWRLVLFVGDIATVFLLLKILTLIKRSRLWLAVYWLNPVVIKEIFNSGHMEAILIPFVMLSLLMAARQRPLLATAALGFAAGAKFWPLLLAPLIWRGLAARPVKLAIAAVLLAGMMLVWIMPMWLGGLGDNAGLVAYTERWQTNSALFPLIERTVIWLQNASGFADMESGRIARGFIAAALGGLVILMSLRPIAGPEDLMSRAAIVVAALVLLSPAQYPWYTVWLAPFLVIRPYRAFLLLTALIPLYYLRFYFISRGEGLFFAGVVVWVIWAPVLTVLCADLARSWFSRPRGIGKFNQLPQEA